MQQRFKPEDLNALRPWATERDEQILDAVIATGSQRRAAKAIGIAPRNVAYAVARMKKRAAQAGHSPQEDAAGIAPGGYHVRGKSILYNQDGKPIMTWLKTAKDHEHSEALLRELAAALTDTLPAISAPPPPSNCNKDIIPWFQIGDGHLGMVAYDVEVGESFDIAIAERELCAALGMMIDQCEPCERAVIQDLGDMTHYETFAAKTEASGHDLDYDSRYPKMIKAYSRTMRYIVDKALAKFKYVDVIINQGNHSRSNDIWIAELLRTAYRDVKRLNILDNSSVFIPYRMGNTFVMTHHSDRCKPDQLAKVMATDFRQDWGETEYHYIDIGHIHHHMVSKEHPGVRIESWNQLATHDKYAHDHGYRSRSCLTVVYRSKTYGEVGRRTLPLEHVRDMLYKRKRGETGQQRRVVHTV